MVDPSKAEGIMGLYFKSVEQFLKRVPNSRRIAAHTPMITMLMLPFTATLQREGAGGLLSSKIKEIAIIKTSHLNGCAYWYAHNTSLGQAAGITEEQVLVIGSDDYMESPLLSDRQKAAVLWAEHVTKNTARSRDDIFEIVSQSFNESEIVELTMVSAYFNMNNRFIDSLKIPIEHEDEVNKIKGSVSLDPDRVRQYLQTILDNWPESFPLPNPD
jgi:alkylhydroperoxidase family enzyme